MTKRSAISQSIRVLALVTDSLGLIKIDVEGHELAALRGAEQSLLRCWPFLLLEADDPHNPNAVERVRAYLAGGAYWITPMLSHGMWKVVPA